MVNVTAGYEDLMGRLDPHLDEHEALVLAMVLLVVFTFSFVALAVWFKVLCKYSWYEDPVRPDQCAPSGDAQEDAEDQPASVFTKLLEVSSKVLCRYVFEPEDGGGDSAAGDVVATSLVMKLQMLVNGWSDLELQRVLQSSSAKAGLIFTIASFLAPYAVHGDLARLLLGFVGLGNQVVLFTWIYVESWGELTNSAILTGTLVTAACSTLSPPKCPSLSCIVADGHRWEPAVIKAMFYFIIITALLNVVLAALPLMGLFRNSPEILRRRVYCTLDEHLSSQVDAAVADSCEHKEKFVSDALMSEIVEWCMQDKYLGEMQEKVYRGVKRTELRVVVTAVPTLVLSSVGMWVRMDWRWGGAAAVALMASSLSAIFFGFLCARQREKRLPLCFSRGIDILESFENATADLFGMNRKEFQEATWGQKGFRESSKGFIETLQKYKDAHGESLKLQWTTCNFMVIQTLGLAELGHFELQAAEWNAEWYAGDDPNSNSALLKISAMSQDVEGLVERRQMIYKALQPRSPVRIGPTAISKIAGVMMSLTNAIIYMKKQGHHSKV